jgi:nicotinamidase/pyrazinamidase
MAPMRHLLIIDPQVDFCDPDGSLYVEGAYEDMARLSVFVEKTEMDRITVSLDTHTKHHIAHASAWLDEHGLHPKPFTMISKVDVRHGLWKSPIFGAWADEYCERLEERGKKLVIWPDHCLIGSQGASVVPRLYTALNNWQERTHRDIAWLSKGINTRTEHYSAIKPEVMESEWSPSEELLELAKADEIIVAGEALSHCVAETVRDLIEAGGIAAKKIILLTDATSPVGGFEEIATMFRKEMDGKGMLTSKTDWLYRS